MRCPLHQNDRVQKSSCQSPVAENSSPLHAPELAAWPPTFLMIFVWSGLITFPVRDTEKQGQLENRRMFTISLVPYGNRDNLNSKRELSAGFKTGARLLCRRFMSFTASFISASSFIVPFCCSCSSQDSSLIALLQYTQACSHFRNLLLFLHLPL